MRQPVAPGYARQLARLRRVGYIHDRDIRTFHKIDQCPCDDIGTDLPAKATDRLEVRQGLGLSCGQHWCGSNRGWMDGHWRQAPGCGGVGRRDHSGKEEGKADSMQD